MYKLEKSKTIKNQYLIKSLSEIIGEIYFREEGIFTNGWMVEIYSTEQSAYQLQSFEKAVKVAESFLNEKIENSDH